MGIRIHKAMGWGITKKRFQEISSLSPDDATEDLYDVMSKTKKLIVPDDICKKTFDTLNVAPILDRNLLAKNFVEFSKQKNSRREKIRPTDLYSHVILEDDKEDDVLIFFPSGHYAKKWFRYNDDMDYAEERWANGGDVSAEGRMEQRVVWTAFNPYPFTNFIVNKTTGESLPWDHFLNLRKRNDWIPAVPEEIKWWTTHLGIFTPKTVLELRPVFATWWS